MVCKYRYNGANFTGSATGICGGSGALAGVVSISPTSTASAPHAYFNKCKWSTNPYTQTKEGRPAARYWCLLQGLDVAPVSRQVPRLCTAISLLQEAQRTEQHAAGVFLDAFDVYARSYVVFLPTHAMPNVVEFLCSYPVARGVCLLSQAVLSKRFNM